MNNLSNSFQLSSGSNQRGVVLVVSLIFLIALTLVAAALMQNSTSDMKMSGATEEKAVALQEVVSAVDEVIYNQIAPGKTNYFARTSTENYPMVDQAVLLPSTNTGSSAEVSVAGEGAILDVDCPRSLEGSSNNVFTCSMLLIEAKRAYGRNNINEIVAESGIAQQLL